MKFFTSETFIQDFLGDEIDVEFGISQYPNYIFVDIHENGIISKSVKIFSETNGDIHVMISDANQWDENFDGTKKPGYKIIFNEKIIKKTT
jgi:hypothetical protein